MHLLQGLTSTLDTLEILDPETSEVNAGTLEKTALEIREKLYLKKRSFLSRRQVSQVSQVTGRNVELMYLCLVLSNIIRIDFDADIEKTFQQKIIEEGERTELGFLGILNEVLKSLWNEKHEKPEYLTENAYVKISNKELYNRYNESLKKECGHGVSPAKFKEFMLEFGFTDALNRKKLEVPTPSEPTPKSRLCNIFTNRVLRKLGIETQETPPKETTSLNLEDLKTVNWSDMFYDEHECCLCGYQKLTCWEAETFKGDKLWICEDCKQEWEKQRNNID